MSKGLCVCAVSLLVLWVLWWQSLGLGERSRAPASVMIKYSRPVQISLVLLALHFQDGFEPQVVPEEVT